MKKFSFICLFFGLSLIQILSQDIEPSALYFMLPQSSGTYLKQFSILDSEYKQNKFMLTWQWGNHPRITKALKMNGTQDWKPTWGADGLFNNTTGETIDFIWQVGGVSNQHLLSNSFTYKPTIDVNSFNPDPNDPEHNIWGFRNRRVTNTVNNKLRLIPQDASVEPVLSNPWRGNCFYLITDLDTSIKGYNYRPYNGKYWNVTLNLRRLDFEGDNNAKDDEPVLEIRIPYFMTKNSAIDDDSISFNKKPHFNLDNLTNMSYSYTVNGNSYTIDRGYCLDMDSSNTKSIIITRNMLPDLADSINGIGPDISITCSFKADGLFGSNPKFKTSPTDTTHNLIDSIGLDVYYHGNCGILLNYIRIGNPMSDKMWKGEYDTYYQSDIQNKIDIIKDKNYKLFRFYGRDELSDHYQLWDAMRYFNKLVGGLAFTEGNSEDPRYFYRTETDFTWFGSLGMGHSAVPHVRKNENEEPWRDVGNIKPWVKLNRMNIRYGFYRDVFDGVPVLDSLSNNYELSSYNKVWRTVRKSDINSIINTTTGATGLDYINYYTNVSEMGRTPQWVIDGNNYPFHTNKNKKDIIYQNNIWWQNYYNLPNN